MNVLNIAYLTAATLVSVGAILSFIRRWLRGVIRDVVRDVLREEDDR